MSTLYVFCMALFVHTLLEGLAIGAFDKIDEMVILGVSIVVHKVPVAYTVGTAFKNKRLPFCHWFTIFYFVTFVISTPVGIIIGTTVSASSGLPIVIIQSLAGGTFIYLACCDFIVHEFQNSHDILPTDTRPNSEKNKT